ncbi:LysR family transcriptional regulator [Luminiphilus sp.]|jgi:DNA-binding transcriptional LysR family regulator|nr:LysR family transcriptional regulator [Luminiphilus sp.]MDA9666675.1 LysR family transcriptional regulator [Luminiphilus sp.]
MRFLDDMVLFAKIVELKSFTDAAHDLGVSRALVSRRLHALEQRLGVRLLNRTTRKLHLTESGATYFQYCQDILSKGLEAEEAIQAIKTAPAGFLRVAMPIPLGQDLFGPLLPVFRSRYPEIQLRLDLSDQPPDLVGSGYDIVVRWGHYLPDSSYIAKTITGMPIITCGTPDYLASRKKLCHPRDLSSHNCLIYSPLREGHEIWRFMDKGKPLALPVAGDIEANHGPLLVHAASAGLGLLFAPEFLVREQIARGDLVEVLAEYRCNAAIWAQYPHRVITQKERALLDFLCEHIPPLINPEAATAHDARTL